MFCTSDLVFLRISVIKVVVSKTVLVKIYCCEKFVNSVENCQKLSNIVFSQIC